MKMAWQEPGHFLIVSRFEMTQIMNILISVRLGALVTMFLHPKQPNWQSGKKIDTIIIQPEALWWNVSQCQYEWL